MKTKICGKCGVKKELNEFSKSKKDKFGVQWACIECRRSPKAKEKAARLKLIPEGFKLCSKCDKEKPFSEFYKNKDCLFGITGFCKKCYNEANKIYREEHPEISKKYRDMHPNQRKKWKRDWDKSHIEERRKYKQENREQEKNRRLKNTYGITLDQYKQMLESQNGVCAICGKPESRKSKYNDYTLSVDHNHVTGKVRGLLCHVCNNCLGAVKENTDTLLNAINYLNKHKD